MNIGSIIKYYRTKQGWTQQELAEGICSVSHLSKIETNMYNGNEDTLNRLLGKMDLTIEDEFTKLREIETTLNRFMDAILTLDTDRADELYETIQRDADYTASSNLVNLYHLYLYRYYMWRGNKAKQQELFSLIQRIKTTFTPIEQNIFTLFSAIDECEQEQDKRALRLLTRFLDHPLSLSDAWIAEAHYLLCKIHTRLYHSEAAIVYGKKAFDTFSNHSNWIRQIQVQLLLGKCYTTLQLFKEAESVYKSLIRNTRMFLKDSYYGRAVLQFAQCKRKQEYYDEAIDLLKIARLSISSSSDDYGQWLIEWIHVHWLTKSIDTQWFQSLKELHQFGQQHDNKFYMHVATYYEKKQFSQHDGVNYATRHLYPFLTKINHRDAMSEMIHELIHYYQNEDKEHEANHYYKEWRLLTQRFYSPAK